MKSGKLKCPKCSYVFEGDTEAFKNNCPLCSTEFDTPEALELYNKAEKTVANTAPKKKSAIQIIFEWLVFFGFFALFIVILYIIIGYIVGA